MTSRYVMLRFDARQFEGCDDRLQAAQELVQKQFHGCRGLDLQPHWEDEGTRAAILLQVPASAIPPLDSSYFDLVKPMLWSGEGEARP